jgi:hypothetical protein
MKIEGIRYQEVGRSKADGIDVVLAAPLKGKGPLRAVPVSEWDGATVEGSLNAAASAQCEHKVGPEVDAGNDGECANAWARTRWPASGPRRPVRRSADRRLLGCSPSMLWLLGVIGALAWLLGCTH